MTTTTRPTQQQIIALRAMLATTGTLGDRLDAGIDACRSPAYHHLVAAHQAELTIRRQDGQSTSDLVAPPAERVPGSTDLRTWLRSEIDRIADIRNARVKRQERPALRSVRTRAVAAVRAAVGAAYRECSYRRAESRWAGGHHGLTINIVSAGHETASGQSDRVWSDNGKWSGNDSSHTLGVSLRWRLDVERRGIAVVDGLLTLAAEPLPELRAGEEAYLVCYLRQGRGVSIETSHAILYRRDGGAWKRAATLTSARRGTGRSSSTTEARP